MTLSETKKLSKHIFRLLKVSEIIYPIGRTSKGNLGLVFNANNDDFDIMLDSVPLSTKNGLEDENNIELKKMIEKYYFEPEQSMASQGWTVSNSTPVLNIPVSQEKKKGGRPKGSKNKNGNTKTKETS